MTLAQLQSITLESQGLHSRSAFGEGKEGVLNALEHLGYIQIDTLSIVARAHHHTLWTRLPDYKAEYLDELVNERKVFEYWFHAAAYLPMKEFRFVLPQMLAVKQNASRQYRADPKVMRYVMDSIRAEGPKKARDFENEKKKPGSWWNWKPAKVALERLFFQGDLMVSGRSGMQKVYDISERVLPQDIDLSVPSPMEYAEYMVKTYLRAYGFTTLKQISHLKKDRDLKKNIIQVVESMLEEGSIQKVEVKGMPTVFVQKEYMHKSFENSDTGVHILSPFDNAIIHRDRLHQIFDFDYKIECYTPKGKRQFGYFCLPLLMGNTFIGRVDCKAHRKEKEFELIHLHLENPDIDAVQWVEPFVKSMKQFATFNGCQSIKLTQVSPSGLKKILKRAFKNHEKQS